MKYNGYLVTSPLFRLLIFVILGAGPIVFFTFSAIFKDQGNFWVDNLLAKKIINDDSKKSMELKLLKFDGEELSVDGNQFKEAGLKVLRIKNSPSCRSFRTDKENLSVFNIQSEQKISWEDSVKTQKNGETEKRTKAQRDYENRIVKLKKSPDPKVRAKGERLEATYQFLKNSAITFHVVMNDRGRGELTYEGVEGHLFINISSKTGFGDMPIICQIAHEFKHAEQFLNGNLGFYRNDRGKWVGWRDDNFDEAEAFMAHFDAEEGDESTTFLKIIRNSIPFGVYAVADILENNQNSPRIYRNRGIESVPVSSILTPRHYAIPKKNSN